MTAQDSPQPPLAALRSLAIIAVAAVVTFLALEAGLFDANHSHIEEDVAAQLRDPSSAQFGEILGYEDTYCGKVNARNGLGGYSGFRRFVHHKGIVLFEPIERPGASISEQADYHADVTRFARLSQRCHGNPPEGIEQID